jgi:hypothetical protein
MKREINDYKNHQKQHQLVHSANNYKLKKLSIIN